MRWFLIAPKLLPSRRFTHDGGRARGRRGGRGWVEYAKKVVCVTVRFYLPSEFAGAACPVTNALSSDNMPSEMGPPAVPKFLYRNGLQKEPPDTTRWAALSQKSGPIPDGDRPIVFGVRAWPCCSSWLNFWRK